MKKDEFLLELIEKLSFLPFEEMEERIGFYSEMIDDRVEEGLSEDEAVEAIGSVKDVVTQILEETPITKLVKERVRPNRSLRALEIVLLVLGSPIWLSLLIAAALVLLSVYTVIWSVVISLWAVEISLGAYFLAAIFAAVLFAFQGNAITVAVMLGSGILCAGLAIFFAFVCMAVTKGVLLLTKKIAFGVKSMFIGKEALK